LSFHHYYYSLKGKVDASQQKKKEQGPAKGQEKVKVKAARVQGRWWEMSDIPAISLLLGNCLHIDLSLCR